MAKPSKPGKQPNQSNGGDEASKDAELVAIGRRLYELREAAGLTQEALAHAAGLHWTHVGQIERGERSLTYKNVLKQARGLGIDPSELLPDRE
jgi:transcriptional regulator with XRE-family HTH domain